MIPSLFTSGMRVNSFLARSLTVSAIATMALLSGVTPNLANSTLQLGQGAVSAQSDEPAITRYVRAAYEMEKTRQSMVSRVKEMTEGRTPDKVCQPSSIAQLQSNIRDQVKGICDNFNAQAAAIVKKYKLSHEEFNSFQKRVISKDPEFSRQIESEIRRLGFQ